MAKKKVAAAKAPAKKPAKKPAAKPAASKKRLSWLAKGTDTPLIDQYARQLDSFIQTMADGEVDASEIKDQEARVVKLMKAVEPELDDAMHEQVTQLLCELTAYDIMQILHSMQAARPKTRFRG